MTPERWARLSPLIDAALDLRASQRAGYIEQAAAGDPILRSDLERLLAEFERGDSLIERAASERYALLLDDGQAKFPALLEERFMVERELGRGGMATVYLAHDRKHDRPVAIKVLRQEVAAVVGAERFLREIRTAARLQHPLIVPLHDSGEADGCLYYVMAYTKGETLRDRLTREPQLPVDEALRVIRDVADAIDHAHANHIVHRDIKPENILLSGGHAMVMDFGLARAVSAPAESVADPITSPGFVIGTPAYMSPEQATADASIDGRTDVYALGCVAYELLAGHAPFMGTTAIEVLSRHRLDQVPGLRTVRPAVPEHVERAIARALAKSPAARFTTAGAFSHACTRAATPPGLRNVLRHPVTPFGAAVLILAGIAVISLFWLNRPSGGTVTAAPSIAVLAFRTIGGDSSNEALSDGLAEDIAATIGRIPGLNVKSPTSSFSLRGKRLTIPEIGRVLGVRYVVDGSLQRDAGRMRVRVTLLESASDSAVWTRDYNRPVRDVFSVQDEIARAIAKELRVQLAPSTQVAISRRSTMNAEAYELYQRGRFFFQRRDSMSMRKAREYFHHAIEVDPNFALAHAGLGDTYSHSSVFGYATPNSMMPRAKEWVERALRLDSTLVEAHSSRAFIATFYEWDWPTAGREFTRAVELDPGYPSAHLWRAWYFLATDSVNAAIESAERALGLEPFVLLTNTRLITFLYYGRRYEDALRQSQRTRELDSTYFQVDVERARVLGQLGRCDEAVDALARAPDQGAAILQGIHGYTYAICGRRAEALVELDRLGQRARRGAYVTHYARAVIHAALGNREEAIGELERGYTERSWAMFMLNVDPAFDSLRSDPRFARLARLTTPG